MVSVYDKNELCHLMAIGYAGFMEDNCNIIINCPYFSIKNQIFRCNMLDNITKDRKNSKKND